MEFPAGQGEARNPVALGDDARGFRPDRLVKLVAVPCSGVLARGVPPSSGYLGLSGAPERLPRYQSADAGRRRPYVFQQCAE